MGFSRKSAATESGTMEATGMASSLRKIATGRSSVMRTVESSGAWTPRIDWALPSVKARAPSMG
jgi:hypothetical protein